MRATSIDSMDDGPDDIEALLPWHAAGTLGAAESRRVEDALARDAALRRQFAAIREERAETVALNETLGAPSPRALQTLMAAIDAEPARTAAPSPRLSAQPRPGRVARFFASLSPRTLAWSASFAAMALVLQAGLIGVILARSGLEAFQSADYSQAAAPPATAAREDGGARPVAPARPRQADAGAPQLSWQGERARPGAAAATDPARQPSMRSIDPADLRPPKEVEAAVTFRPDARMADIAALLGSYQASVIGSDGGALRLRFAGMTTAADLNIILGALSRERIVAAAVAAPRRAD